MASEKFTAPILTKDAELEFRLDGTEIQIYGSGSGLRRLADYCNALADRCNMSRAADHLHLEDYEILTPTSLRAMVGVFPTDANGEHS